MKRFEKEEEENRSREMSRALSGHRTEGGRRERKSESR